MNRSHIERTKTYDIGLMQINSSWLPRLEKMGITEAGLKEPCQNVLVGAWILSHHLKESGADWNGVGSYNASCRTLSKSECENARNTYAWKVYRALMKQRNLVPEQGGAIRDALYQNQVPAKTTARVIRTVVASTSNSGDTGAKRDYAMRATNSADDEVEELDAQLEAD